MMRTPVAMQAEQNPLNPGALKPRPLNPGQHPFRLLATALVGRPIYIAYLTDPEALAYADGEHIYVSMNAATERQRQEILVQGLLTAGGSLQRSLMLDITGRPTLRQRYLALEVERCARIYANRLPSGFLQQLAPYRTGQISDGPQQSLALAKGLRSVPATPDWFGTIHPLKLLRSHAPASARPLDEKSLSELESKLQELGREHAKDKEKDEENAVKDNLWQKLSSPLGSEGFFSKMLRDLLDMSSSPDEKSSTGGSGSSMEKVSARVVKRLRDTVNALRATTDVVLSSAFILPEVGAHSYPEWDVGRQRYKAKWTTVEEVEAHTDEPVLDASALGATSNIRYQRALAGLCFNYERHRGQKFGDDFVLDRLVDLRISLRSGVSGDDRVYQANLKTRRELGVQILLDASSSTLEFVDSSTPGSSKKICDLQAEAAWQLCRAFSQLGDRVALHGFHSWGRALVRFQRLKTFDEGIGATIEHRFKNLSIAGYTRCGAAIRHGADQLQRFSGMPRQLLLVISDGYPYDDQYEGAYAAADTKKALEEVRKQGIACVCLSVGSDADSARLKKIYGDANYLAVDKVDKLATRLRPVIEAAVAAALTRG